MNPNVTQNKDGTTKRYIFRAGVIDAFQGQMMARFALKKGFMTAFIMYDQNDDYSKTLAEAFEGGFAGAGGRIVGKETYNRTDTDFSAILNKAAESQAEILYVPDTYNIANLVGAQAKQRGLKAVMMGGDGWESPDLNLVALDGSFYSTQFDPGDTRPIVTAWVAAYQKKYDGKLPDSLAALGYDTTNLLLTAITKNGVDDPDMVAAMLMKIKDEFVTGVIAFDEHHNPVKNVAVVAVKNGNKTFETSVSPYTP